MREGKLRKVGSLWKPRSGGKSHGMGEVTINGLKQKFVVLTNDRKEPGSKQPDYVLMSSEEPEVDRYEGTRGARRPAGGDLNADDIPF